MYREEYISKPGAAMTCGGATIAESPFYDFTFFVKAARQQNVDNFFLLLS